MVLGGAYGGAHVPQQVTYLSAPAGGGAVKFGNFSVGKGR